MKSNRIPGSSSRRKTSWNAKPELTPAESFIKSNYLTHYDEKHPHLNQTNEAELINSYPVTECPYCASHKLIRSGFDNNGIHIYRYKECGRRFTRITCTIFQDHKISVTEWIEYCLYLMDYISLSAAGKYWIEKIKKLLDSTMTSPVALKFSKRFIVHSDD